MAPAPDQWPYPDVPNEREAFLDDVQAFHAQRGTSFDREPKTSSKHIDLWRLFNRVQDLGGYDKVSSEKLRWRELSHEFGFSQPAYAFQIKSIFYKYLSAYTIKKVYQQEPPPKEILEDLTAKGGDLLTRTLENYRPSLGRGQAQDGDKDGSGDEGPGTTPTKADRIELDDPSSAGRGGRNLRQQPSQRVIFQPDVGPARQSRNAAAANALSPQPTALVSSTNYPPHVTSSSASAFIQNYEPPRPISLTLRPVSTPKNNPRLFHMRLDRMRDEHRAKLRKREVVQKGMLLPGTGFDGPNIYVRTVNALRSDVEDEQAYSLQHLIKITDFRGDKFRFDAFTGLAEGLIEKALEVSSLYYNVKWKISYDMAAPTELNVLDGLRGTRDIAQRVQKLRRRPTFSELQPQDYANQLSQCTNAIHVLRNMVMLPANAQYLASQLPARDLLSILLRLPEVADVIEIKHDALEIAEQLVGWYVMPNDDPLFQALLVRISEEQDRGAILTACRAICRISYHLPEPHLLPQMPTSMLIRLQNWLLLEDDELVEVCLIFFYAYTAVPANVLSLLEEHVREEFNLHSLTDQLARFLLHNAKEDLEVRTLHPPSKPHKATGVASLPESLLKSLINMPETERSTRWLCSLFEEDANECVTQLELWQAYQNTFAAHCPASGPTALLAAADFIRNVSSTFQGASAQIEKSDVEGASPRFIIRGICYKHAPTDSKGQPYTRCLWTGPSSNMPLSPIKPCNSWHQAGQVLYEHIILTHLGVTKDPVTNTFKRPVENPDLNASIDCHWANCRRFSRLTDIPSPSAAVVAKHVRTHLPDPSASAKTQALHTKHNKNIAPGDPRAVYTHKESLAGPDPKGYEGVYATHAFADTLLDDHNAPAGVPYWAVMVLRNLARNVPKAVGAAPEDSVVLKGGRFTRGSGEKGRMSAKDWIEELFLQAMHHFWHVFAYNRSLGAMVWELITFVEKGMKAVKEREV